MLKYKDKSILKGARTVKTNEMLLQNNGTLMISRNSKPSILSFYYFPFLNSLKHHKTALRALRTLQSLEGRKERIQF